MANLFAAFFAFLSGLVPIFVLVFFAVAIRKSQGSGKSSRRRTPPIETRDRSEYEMGGFGSSWSAPKNSSAKPASLKSYVSKSKDSALSGEYRAPAAYDLSKKSKSSRKSVLKAPAGSYSSGMHISSDFMRDDRQNDWLAKQMREEQRVLRKGGMLDLGAAHDADCDARALKRAHLFVHDDSIDDGEY